MMLPIPMFRTLVAACFAAVLILAPVRAAEQPHPVITFTATVTWTTEGDPGADEFTDPALLDDESLTESGDDAPSATTRRYAPAPRVADRTAAKDHFGPFAVIDGVTVRMAGDVDGSTPRAFAAMLAAYPTLKRLEMVDCPGSLDEEANLILARAIRRAGMATIVPAGGSVRSGAVELFLAGVTRSAAPDAEFGVHSWRDENGYEARDYPADDPVHAEYLGYYREMGLDADKARAFYAMTNSTSFDDVRYLTRDDMARFVTLN